MISVKKYGQKTKNNSPVFRFHGNAGHLGFHGTHQGTYNFKTITSNALKRCTCIEDIWMKNRTEVFLSFVELGVRSLAVARRSRHSETE